MVQMSRNVVVSFAEGYIDVLDDKKNRGYMSFCSRFGGGGAVYEVSIYEEGIHGTLQQSLVEPQSYALP